MIRNDCPLPGSGQKYARHSMSVHSMNNDTGDANAAGILRDTLCANSHKKIESDFILQEGLASKGNGRSRDGTAQPDSPNAQELSG